MAEQYPRKRGFRDAGNSVSVHNPKDIEDEVLEFWKKNKIRQKAVSLNKEKKKFYFHDGPPYATGQIHIGTAWNKSLKDMYIRFFRMSGFSTWCQPGYDTHGTPIETKVEKKFGFTSKKDIEKFGIEKFNRECRRFATEHIESMSRQFEDLVAAWMDWERPYITLENYFIEGCWFTFKTAYEKGFLYKGIYPVHVCPHCATAVAYNEIEHANLSDTGIYVKFPVEGGKNKFFIIYTTTPWTLPGNTGIMANPDFEYAEVKVDDEIWIVAKDVAERLGKKFGKKLKILKVISGSELEGLKYENPLLKNLELPEMKNAYRVILSERYVHLEEGTGLVHTAPGHGREDYDAGTKAGLPVICPVELDGTLKKECGKYSGKVARIVDKEIINDLNDMGFLAHKESITHEYPVCWRCKNPLLQMSVPQWFFRVTGIRDKLLKENEKVNWYPADGKKRFEDWLNNLGDWPISRQRFWGIPLPIWECKKCKEIKVIGSAKELPIQLKDLHRPYIDEIVLKCKCGGEMKRVEDVSDVWFDSGCSSWASLNYPNQKELFEKLWPPDLEMEGSDMFRGWWNSQMLAGVMTFGKVPFKNVLVHGMVYGLDKKEMHKSLGNFITPEEVVEKYGKDSMRFYLLKSDNGSSLFLNWDELDSAKKFLNTIHNTVNFFETYCAKDAKLPKKLSVEDRWILSRANTLIKEVENDMKNFAHFRGLAKIEDFIVNDFSRLYIKTARDRIGKEKETISAVMGYALEKTTKLLAPFCPFLTENIYQKLFRNAEKTESVHLCSWPKIDESKIDKTLEEQMETIKKIVETSNSIRQDNAIKLKYPLYSLTVSGSEKILEAAKNLKRLLEKMANVKEVKFGKEKPEYEIKINYAAAGKKFGKDIKAIEAALGKEDAAGLKAEIDKKGSVKIGDFVLGDNDLIFREKAGENKFAKPMEGGKVELDPSADGNLKKEWLLRELIRAVQEKRKEIGLLVSDRIKLYLSIEFEEFGKRIESETGSGIIFGKASGEKSEFEFEGKKYVFGIEKV
ncbi:MAG: isoleucine--tRNA ligase [Nanoarchaeota archaeon]|nr:isoleucine--tRNA ligase [Nanoarchaeota archaeon]